MILYRKVTSLRVRRSIAPEPPFWAATSIAPYGPRRATPVSIDYGALLASGADRLEVTVSEHVRDELERARTLNAPVLIDATEGAEVVFRRGEEALRFCNEQRLPAALLTSTRSVAPPEDLRTTLVISAWPLEAKPLRDLFARAAGRRWGVVVPVIFPVTTDLAALEELAGDAHAHGASFFAALGVEVEATAKQAIAQSMELAADDDRYAILFHADVAPIQLATERHIAALASERGMLDFVPPPDWEARTNWNASVLLTLVAGRMMAMELDLDLAGLIARSARAVAELDKPLTRIAEAASLSIVGALDEVSAEMLTEWLASGTASFAEHVHEQWRLHRR